MTDMKVVKELVMLAKEVAAAVPTSASMVEDSLSRAISALSYLGVEYAFNNERDGQVAKGKVKQALALLEDVIDTLPTPVTYQVVGVEGISSKYFFSNVAELEKALAAKGIRKVGVQSRGNLRKELIGQPTFDKLIGPMYNGPKRLRYETQETYDQMSA
jgi:hypothetical protein